MTSSDLGRSLGNCDLSEDTPSNAFEEGRFFSSTSGTGWAKNQYATRPHRSPETSCNARWTRYNTRTTGLHSTIDTYHQPTALEFPRIRLYLLPCHRTAMDEIATLQGRYRADILWYKSCAHNARLPSSA
jgi:hypothetical protein